MAEKIEELKEIDLGEFTREEREEPEEEIKEEREAEEEDKYIEVSLSTQMLIALVGMALSMRYLPDSAAVKAFNKRYREELPHVIESFGLEEVFEQVLSSTLTFKLEKSDILTIPLPAWVGLVAVIGVLVVAGLFIRVPTKKGEKAKEKGGEGESKT